MEYVKAKETSTEKPKQINDKPILSDEMETNTEEFQIGSLLNPQDIPPLAEAMPEPIPEVVPVAEAVPEPIPEVPTEVVPIAEPVAEAVPEIAPVAQPIPEVVPVAEAVPEVAEAIPEVVPVPEAIPEVVPVAEPIPEVVPVAEPIPEVVPVAEAVPEVAEAISPETAEETESLEKKKQLQTERKSRLLAQKEEMKRKIITLNISLSDPNHSFEQREPIYQEIIKVQESLLFINGYYARLILAEQVEANQEN